MNCWRCDKPFDASNVAPSGVGHNECRVTYAENMLHLAANPALRAMVLEFWSERDPTNRHPDNTYPPNDNGPHNLDELVQWWREHWDLVVRYRTAFKLDAEDGFWERDPPVVKDGTSYRIAKENTAG